MLLIAPYQGYHAAEWANACVLGISLQVGAETLGKHLDGALVCKLHLELKGTENPYQIKLCVNMITITTLQ